MCLIQCISAFKQNLLRNFPQSVPLLIPLNSSLRVSFFILFLQTSVLQCSHTQPVVFVIFHTSHNWFTFAPLWIGALLQHESKLVCCRASGIKCMYLGRASPKRFSDEWFLHEWGHCANNTNRTGRKEKSLLVFIYKQPLLWSVKSVKRILFSPVFFDA